jgi:hypothetical protein
VSSRCIPSSSSSSSQAAAFRPAAAPLRRAAPQRQQQQLQLRRGPTPPKAVELMQLAELDIDWSDPDTQIGALGAFLGVALGIGAPMFYASRDDRDEERLEELRALNRATKEETGEFMSPVGAAGWGSPGANEWSGCMVRAPDWAVGPACSLHMLMASSPTSMQFLAACFWRSQEEIEAIRPPRWTGEGPVLLGACTDGVAVPSHPPINLPACAQTVASLWMMIEVYTGCHTARVIYHAIAPSFSIVLVIIASCVKLVDIMPYVITGGFNGHTREHPKAATAVKAAQNGCCMMQHEQRVVCLWKESKKRVQIMDLQGQISYCTLNSCSYSAQF